MVATYRIAKRKTNFVKDEISGLLCVLELSQLVRAALFLLLSLSTQRFVRELAVYSVNACFVVE